MKKENMMDTKEAAEYIRFSVSTLTKWRHRDEGPEYVKLMGRIFYDKETLDKWLAGEESK